MEYYKNNNLISYEKHDNIYKINILQQITFSNPVKASSFLADTNRGGWNGFWLKNNDLLSLIKVGFNSLKNNQPKKKVNHMKNTKMMNIKQKHTLDFKELKFIDLFSGVGGLSYNLRNKGLNCVFSCDFDKFVNETYYLNYAEKSNGDITKIDPASIPNHNILLAGFPCQAFSIAGLRKGFQDERGALFLNILKILKEKKPEYFILENVKGLITHEKGETFKFILEKLKEHKYFVK